MRFYWICVGVAVLGGTAWADSQRSVVEAVAACSQIAAAPDRLKCFDAAAQQAQAALASAEPAPAQATQTQAETDSGGVLGWFGLERPVTKPEDFGKPPPRPDGPKEITTLAASVSEFARTPTGRVLFVLDNGQIWRQIEADSTNVRDPSDGAVMKVKIEKAFLGSYSLTIDGRAGIIKVHRVR